MAGMQVWDIQRASHAFQQLQPNTVISLHGQDTNATAVMLAALGENNVASVELVHPPAHHRQTEDYLNIARIIEPRQIAGLLLAQGTDVTAIVESKHLGVWNEVANAVKQFDTRFEFNPGVLKIEPRQTGE
jgi:Trk K+ transport system NAD-binding subunit